MRTRKAVGAIIVNKKNDVLLAHKVKIMDGDSPKTISEWDFIKGGMKEGEDTNTALKRELLEEANINEYIPVEELPEFTFEFSDELKSIIKYDNQVTYVFKVLVDTDKTDIRPDFDEIDELRFMSVNEALNIMCHDTSKTYLKSLIKKGILV
ncbi:MAG: NUDIX hydrolase [Chitinispirillales bacterium]|jgi:putative (di)nucleoside polyphosphate hydrolase|nr:NUDIX hydrolase [Chitinispirillales bacterium]